MHFNYEAFHFFSRPTPTSSIVFTYHCPKVAVRPSVKDRRAIIGNHKRHKNLYLMNGLGSRGMLLSPYLASQLCSNIIENKKINSEIDINRFY